MNWYIPERPGKSINGTYFCPMCKITVLIKSRACFVCGQLFDWDSESEEEETYENEDEEV